MILITRPREEAKALEKEFLKNGKKSTIDSLIHFEFYFKKIPFDKNVLYLISSAQSVKALSKYKKRYNQLLTEGNFIVVGKKVAADLKKIANLNIIKVANDSDDMTVYLLSQSRFKKNYKKIIFISGTVFNKEFVQNLKKNKFEVKRKIIYSTFSKKNFTKRTINLFNQRKISYIVLFSNYTARIFLKLIKLENLQDKVSNIPVVSLSKRIDMILKRERLFQQTFVAKKPTQNSLIDQLNSLNK